MKVLSPICLSLLIAASPAQAAEVSTHLELDKNAAEPTLVFTLRNVGNDVVWPVSLGTNNNAVLFLYPTGAVGGRFNIADPPLRFPSTQVASRVPGLRRGETQTLRETVQSLIPVDDGLHRNHGGPGVYRVYWEVYGVRSNEVVLERKAGQDWTGKRLQEPDVPDPTLRAPQASLASFLQDMSEPWGKQVTRWVFTQEELLKDPHRQWVPDAHLRILLEGHAGRVAVLQGPGTFQEPGVWPYNIAGKPTIDAILAAHVTFSEDHFLEARLRPKGWSRDVHLVRDGGRWLVAKDNFLVNGEPDPRLVREVEILEDHFKREAVGEYEAAGGGKAALRKRLPHSLILEILTGLPATSPTTAQKP